jgi:hypothetical protein
MIFSKLPLSVSKMYDSLLISCSKPECNTVVPLKELFKHENSCGAQECLNFEKCGKQAPLLILGKRVCSEQCCLVDFFRNEEEISDELIFKLLRNFTENISNDYSKIRTFHCFWMEPSQNDGDPSATDPVEEAKIQGLAIDHQEGTVVNEETEKKCYKSAVGAYVS